MGWLSDTFSSARDYIANDLVGDLQSAGNYVVSGEAFSDLGSVIVTTGETIGYAVTHPIQTSHLVLEGVQQGVGNAAGFVGGVVGGAGGLVADSFNSTVRAVSGGHLELYEGGFGTGAGYMFSASSAAVDNAFVGATDYALSAVNIHDPIIRNEHDARILGATQGITEVAAGVVFIAATGGAGAALITGSAATGLATTGSMITATYATNTALAITGAGTAYSIYAGVDEQFNIIEAETQMIIDTYGAPEPLAIGQ